VKFDPRALFEATAMPHRPRRYQQLADELAAVARGGKPVAYVAMEHEAIASREFHELYALAATHELAVVIDPGEEMARVFALRHGDMWRVPALRTLFASAFTDGAWSHAAEAQLAALLGYTDKEIAAWLAHHRWNMVAWGWKTIYTVLDAAQRAQVERLGQRAFGDALDGATVFAHAQSHDLVRRPTVPRGLTLARAALRPEVATKLLDTKRGAVVSGIVRGSIDAALGASIQLLVANRWR